MWLNESYNKETFKNFLSDFLPDDLDLSEKELVIRDSYKEIKSGVVLGECPSLGLKILQLEHEKERDPRVALAKEAFKALAENWAKKALVVFTSKNSDNWRLSFMTISFDINEKNRVVTNLSNPKRKSFFLGPDSKIATPNKFLIKNGKVKNIEDLESRFDVEVVTKEFFDNYRKLFDKLNSYLKEDRAFNVFAGNNRIKIDDFAKKLLGQIVFIYFLQRKGWLGAKKEQHIYEGGSNFIRNLYNRCVNKKGNFFNDTLEYLFYDAFNKEPEKAGSFYREYFDCQIPFLNGGLFESLNKYDWKNKILDLPNELFSNSDKTGILDIFDLYNFTIDENSPIDQEVSVDPEMLGKVFEKLLDTNKETGSFYTPREVVSYMVKQSLIEYLKTKTDVKDKDIEELINEHRISNQDLNKKDFKAIEDALKEIKIIDPAVGSGAFPVGILQEMTEIRKICLDKITVKPRLAYDIKREILENNIYGVDIDHGAIDIARLRFWLSLVVDADLFDVEPLPNLDFKLTAANTLLKLDKQQGLSDDTELLGKMKGLREKYFRARTRNGKEKIQKSFEKLIGINKTVDAFETSRQKQIKTYNPFSPSTVAQFFDPEFMFGVKEFDLVIGNPPYGETIKSNKKYFKENFKCTEGKFEIYKYFIERSLGIMKKGAILTFITPDTWIALGYFKKLRKLIIEKYFLYKITNTLYEVFENATVDTNIFFIKNATSDQNLKIVKSDLKSEFVKELKPTENYTISTKEYDAVVENIEKNTLSLGSITEIWQGLIAYGSKKQPREYSSSKQESELYKKLLFGGDISKYHIGWNGKYLKYGKWLHRPRPLYIFDKPKLLVQRIRNPKLKIRLVVAYDDKKFINGTGMSNILLLPTVDNFDLKYLLAMLNSSAINYWFNYYFTDVNIKPEQLRKIPIVKASSNKQKVVVGKINKILEITSKDNYNSKNPPVEQKELEREINEMVYELYGLTEEDIKIVEKSIF